MQVRDIMTSNVITISSDTLMVEAGKMMEFHKIERLPVVDRGKLVGTVTRRTLDKSGPSAATSLARWELNYLLSKITVKEIMKREVVTVTPDSTVESAIATAQSNKVGSLPVVEDGKVVGIVTTNDIFYKILNPLMGINEVGTRIAVHGASTPDEIHRVMECIGRSGVGVKAVLTVRPSGAEKNDLIIHLDTEDAGRVLELIKSLGFVAETRQFKPC